MQHRRFFPAILIAGIFFAQANRAWPCSCREVPLEKEFAEAAAVFSGTPLEKKPDKRHWQLKKPDGTFETVTVEPIEHVRFTIDRKFKGDLPREVTVVTSAVGTMCGFYFHLGARYLVYAHKDQNGLLNASVCSRTKPYNNSGEELKQLNTFIEKRSQ